MEKTKNLVVSTSRVINFLLILSALISVAILQQQIVILCPDDSGSTRLQSWMTGLTLFFLFFEITELYDDTEMMIFKPDEYAK